MQTVEAYQVLARSIPADHPKRAPPDPQSSERRRRWIRIQLLRCVAQSPLVLRQEFSAYGRPVSALQHRQFASREEPIPSEEKWRAARRICLGGQARPTDTAAQVLPAR